jgi:hypothetical protein
MTPALLFRIVAPKFVAGGLIRQYVVIKAAPILNTIIGCDITEVIEYCTENKWVFQLL